MGKRLSETAGNALSRIESKVIAVLSLYGFSTCFLSGLSLGILLQHFMSRIFRHYRISERLRLYYNKTWTTKEKAPWRLPNEFVESVKHKTAASSRVVVDSAYGTVRVLVSPENVATSTLHISVVSIQPGCELISARSEGVEVYQVLSGSGMVSQQGTPFHETSVIEEGQLWVVDSGSYRWISNNGTKNSREITKNLVLLRTVDRAYTSYSTKSDVNRIVLDPGRRTLSIVEGYCSAVKGIQRVASDCYKRISFSNLRE
jgi:mannose-6-phosphate isomerase-like protein (cupin superfamily)